MNGHVMNANVMSQFKMPPRPTIMRPAPPKVQHVSHASSNTVQSSSMGIPNGASTMEPTNVPKATLTQPSFTTQRPVQSPLLQPTIKKPELKTLPQNLVVQASAATTQSQPNLPTAQPSSQPPQQQSTPPPQQQPQPLPPASAPAPVISSPPVTPVSQSQVITQILSDQLRVQLKTFETKIETKIETLVRDVVSATIRDLKIQFETSQIMGEVLSDKLPVFAQPDTTTLVRHTLAKATKLKLYMPFTSNVHGYWATTSFVTSNGSVATGYVPIFSAKLDGVDYGLPVSELKLRRDQWKSHLDQLCDKEFIPNVGRFE